MSWRVWARHWVVAYTSDADGDAGVAECTQVYQQRYCQNVQPDEWDVRPGQGHWPAALQLRLPVVAGEFRYREAAEEYRSLLAAQDQAGIAVAELGSAEDKALESYGKKKLPS